MPWGRCALAVSKLLVVSALDEQCKDPLFMTHWFSRPGYSTEGLDQEHLGRLNSIPTMKTLRYCPQYNHQVSCCNDRFEDEQEQYMDFFRNTFLPAHLMMIMRHRDAVDDVRSTIAYSAATHIEQEQLRLALESFNAVLHPALHGECFASVMTYTAGVICFACRPDWFNFVTLHGEDVVRVHIDPAVCMELWSHCEDFGRAAKQLVHALLDSALAKQASAPYEDLSMYFDEQALCNWLHDEVALHPFSRPSQAEREEALAAQQAGLGPGDPDEATELPDVSTSPTVSSDGKGFESKQIQIMNEGRDSTFAVGWQRGGAHGTRTWPCWTPSLLSVLWICLSRDSAWA